MRKYVEDTFRIMKGRWHILKDRIRVHRVNNTDRGWLTCCALHNWLLKVDGLDEVWRDGVLVLQTSDWFGELGDHNFEDMDPNIPIAVAQLSSNLNPRNYNLSGMGAGSDTILCHPVDLDLGMGDEAGDKEGVPGVREVRKLSLGYFWRKLVKHFDILWQKNVIKWPARQENLNIN